MLMPRSQHTRRHDTGDTWPARPRDSGQCRADQTNHGHFIFRRYRRAMCILVFHADGPV